MSVLWPICKRVPCLKATLSDTWSQQCYEVYVWKWEKELQTLLSLFRWKFDNLWWSGKKKTSFLILHTFSNYWCSLETHWLTAVFSLYVCPHHKTGEPETLKCPHVSRVYSCFLSNACWDKLQSPPAPLNSGLEIGGSFSSGTLPFTVKILLELVNIRKKKAQSFRALYKKPCIPPQLAAPENSLHPSENLPFSKSPRCVCWQKGTTEKYCVFALVLMEHYSWCFIHFPGAGWGVGWWCAFHSSTWQFAIDHLSSWALSRAIDWVRGEGGK